MPEVASHQPSPTPTRIGDRTFLWGTRTYLMGIVNVTPDSFSGDGLGLDIEAVASLAQAFVAEGADILDVGGESTRPGSSPVDATEEARRVVPAIRRLTAAVDAPISVDTHKAEVAGQALGAGAKILNDIWGLRRGHLMAKLAAQTGAPLIVMHNQHGTTYGDLVPDVIESLRWSVEKAVFCGVRRENIIVDPGFGFGKTAEHNLEVVRRLDEFKVLGQPILLGPSRKSTIGLVLGLPVEERVEGTAAIIALAIAKGADIVRVHDVRQMARVARMSDAIVRGWRAK